MCPHLAGDPGWSPCLSIPWDRPARWQAIGTPPVPVGGLQMRNPALPPTTRKAAVLQTTVPESVNKSQRRLHAGLRTKIQLGNRFSSLTLIGKVHGLAQPVVTSFWPQIGPQLQTRMCTEQEKNAAHWF